MRRRSRSSTDHDDDAGARREGDPNGVKAGRSRILVGPDAYLFDFLARTMPTHYYSVLQAIGQRVSPPPADALAGAHAGASDTVAP